MPEITQSILDKGFINVYVRNSTNPANYFELTQGIIFTSGGISVENNGVRLGKVILIHKETASTATSEAFLTQLNSLNLEVRISALK